MARPMCPSRPTVPHGTGGTVLGTPIVPHGMGGTVLGTPIVPPYMALSHVSVPSHRPTWDGWDCPRDSHVSRHTWLVPCVRPVPLSHMGQDGTVLGTPMCPIVHSLSQVSVLSHYPTWDRRDCPRDSHCPTLRGSVPCVRPVPSSHMGWVGLS